MAGWTFRNVTAGGTEIHVRSAEHAAELLAEQTGSDGHAVVLEFAHGERGFVSCVAGSGLSTLAFHPGYDHAAHSLAGLRNALRVQPVRTEPLYFVDNTGVVSSIPPRYVLPGPKVEQALRYIIEHNDFPGFVRWSDGNAEG